MDLQAGQKLRDNDPRMEGKRIIVIESVGQYIVVCRSGARFVHVSKSRIHTDGKPRRTGFDLVTDPATA
jgi:hypothetical protein